MRYILRIVEDTYNSDAIDDLEVRVVGGKIYMQIVGEKREIAVSREDLRAVLVAAEERQP